MTETRNSAGEAYVPILVLGAGPTGLGAAYRLQERGEQDFLVLEKNSYPGGLAASFTDPRGFTWDLGGHVQFSHYGYFDEVMDEVLEQGWIHHLRQSHTWIGDRFVPYPFQYNLRFLPKPELWRCLRGLLALRGIHAERPANLKEWILATFGEGIAELFLLPYNAKVWAHPPEMLSHQWVGERVAVVDLERALENIVLERDDDTWGPNRTFRFPRKGGTGAIWRTVALRIPSLHLIYRAEAVGLNCRRRQLWLKDGRRLRYDALISTAPLDVLAAISGRADWQRLAHRLAYCSTHVVGIGVEGATPEDLRRKNWMYFPEERFPFYRVTVFSNYSPNNVPAPARYWSLMAEISESRFRPVRRGRLAEAVIRGLQEAALLPEDAQVVSVWRRFLPRGYPVPTTDRDEVLEELLASMESEGIFSRGRFGAWKYEVANQDHSFMQGVEAADRILSGTEEVTVHDPQRVNSGTLKEDRRRQEAVAAG